MSILMYLYLLSKETLIRFKFLPNTGVVRTVPSNISVSALGILEPSVIVESSELKIYFTGGFGDTQNVIYMATATTAKGTWTYSANQIIGLGYGGAPSNRQAHSSMVFKANGFYYCIATNGYGFGSAGEDRNIYLYKSTDGVTFTDLGLLLNKSSIPADGFGNSSIYPVLVNGKYELLVDAFKAGIWQIYRFQSTSIESGWTFINAMPTLQVVAGGMFGGMHHFYLNNKWHIFYHYGINSGNLPTVLGYATSDDLVTVQLKETPLFGIEAQPYGALTDQLADPFIFEHNGKTFMLAEYVKNTTVVESQMWIWEYDGTMSQLIS